MALATASAPTSAASTPNPVLVLPIGHSVFRLLAETASREGVDLNSLAVGLLMLGLGRQSAVVAARRHQVADDDALNTPVRTVCINCGRPRSDPAQVRCSTCGGGWCTSFG
jgi:hypothetical protein